MNALLSKIGTALQPLVLLLVRLTWGYQLAESGWGHLTHVQKTAQFFESLHIPFPVANVYLSGTTEFLGGVLLILGLFSRIVSLPLIVNFCVAYLTASRGDLIKTFHQKGASEGYDAFINDSAFPFLVMCLLILAFGAGAISLDRAFFGRSAQGKVAPGAGRP